MKILQINSVVNRGSTGRIAENIGLKVLSEGIASYIAHGVGHGVSLSDSTLIPIGTKFDFYRHALFTRLFDRHGFSSVRSTKKLVQQIESISPDIIHLHNIHGYYINIKILFDYLSKVNIPIIWTLHDCWAITGHCAYFDYVNCQKWKTGCYSCPNKCSYPKSWFIDNSKNNFDLKKELFNLPNLHLVAVSQWLKNIIEESYLRKLGCSVINNGIDLSIFRILENNRTYLDIDSKKLTILGVANVWEERKGLKDFLELSTKLPNLNFVLVGLSKLQIKKLPVGVVGIERTENIEELVQLYNIASVYVNPTYEDNFPTTNIEALACGTPVITYNTGGSPEAIDSNTGFVIERGDIPDLIHKIEEVCTKGKNYYKQSCRLRAIDLYNMKDRYKDYIELYKKILNK